VTKQAEETWLYEPDEPVAPGETLTQWLEYSGTSQADLARRADLSAKHVNQLVKGLVPLSPQTALSLEKVTGISARFWSRLEADFRELALRQKEEVELARWSEWAKQFPNRELMEREYISSGTSPGDQVRQLLRFFGVASPEAYDRVWRIPTAYRLARTKPSDPVALSAWLRIGEIKAARIATNPFDRDSFIEALGEVRKLTVRNAPKDWLPELQIRCAEAGVAIVVEPELKKSRINGAVRWLTPEKALLQLSFRYRWFDVFWFSFFHEAGHLLKHGKRIKLAEERDSNSEVSKSTLVDDGEQDPILEKEADDFARQMLIPAQYEKELDLIHSESSLKEFARKVGISPDIVLGRLQFEKRLPYSALPHLKRRFKFQE
jgi:HTH-type transcriptional regulator/antitoxin HigA